MENGLWESGMEAEGQLGGYTGYERWRRGQDSMDGDGVYRTGRWNNVEVMRREESKMAPGILIKQLSG